jgi:hypothetical protein
VHLHTERAGRWVAGEKVSKECMKLEGHWTAERSEEQLVWRKVMDGTYGKLRLDGLELRRREETAGSEEF